VVDKLRELVSEADVGDDMGLLVADAVTGETWFAVKPDVPRNPASNMKLVTAATAIAELGPDYSMRTLVAGNMDDAGNVETLLLQGEGDPSLTYADLVELAQDLRERGLRRVQTVHVDGSFFDDEILPPAYDQQPGEVAAFRAPVGAVSVDRNSYVLRIVPGPAIDAPASVLLRAPGYFDVESSITTTASDAPSVLADQRAEGDKLVLRLRGNVPMGVSGLSYRRRIADPLPYAGYAFRAALTQVGVKGPMTVATGKHPGGLRVLASHDSLPLGTHLARVGKHSDNFVAETLLKIVGARALHGPGSSKAGLERSRALLKRCGVDASKAQLVNGSGLFDGNLIAPSHLVGLLRCAYNDPNLHADYLAHLSIAGTDGTLHKRMTDLPKPGVVRAKTGTLNSVISLSGYVLGPRPDKALAFSFLINGVAGKQWKARQLADDMVRALARHLYAATP